MEPEFWHVRWREGRLGFHQDEVHRLLLRHWDGLGVEPGGPVFVPLCGKSRDLSWLRERGHPVLGVELSEIAVLSFFREHDLSPERSEQGRFLRFESEGICLLVGDLFHLSAADLAGVRGVWDRGSLVALPAEPRAAYARHLAQVLPPGARSLLVTLEYDEERMSGPPFSLSDAQVAELFAPGFRVRLVAEESGPEVAGPLRGRGLETLREVVFALERRADRRPI